MCVCVCQRKLTFHLCGLSFNKSRLPTDTVNWAPLLCLERALVSVKERPFSSVTTRTVIEFWTPRFLHDFECPLQPYWVFAGVVESSFVCKPNLQLIQVRNFKFTVWPVFNSDVVVQWWAPSPHNKKVVGLNVVRRFPPGFPAPYHRILKPLPEAIGN